MSVESPGWCKRCGVPIEQSERSQGRPREYCSDRCRTAYSRLVRLHLDLSKEVGLSDGQISRLLHLFTVTPKKRDASASRSGSREGIRGQ